MDHNRVQLLGKETLSSLREAFAIVREEEGLRQVILYQNPTNGLAWVTT